MLEMRPSCENCGKQLPNESSEAMICTFECTFCIDCVTSILYNVCPNCGGGLEKRPTRPKKLLEKYPTSHKTVLQSINKEKFKETLDRYKDIIPNER